MSLSRRQLLSGVAAAAIAPSLPALGAAPKKAVGKFSPGLNGGLCSVRIDGVSYELRGDIVWEPAHWEVAEPFTGPLPFSASGTLSIENQNELEGWLGFLQEGAGS